MDDNDNFALVPRPPGALEKAEPGAKRVLSGMIADTLALAKKEPVRTSRPHRIVVVYDEDGPRKSLEFVLRHLFPDAKLLLCQSSVEALEVLSRSDDPDLFITGTWFHVVRGKEFVERLMDRKATYPIVVASAYEPEETWVREYARRGVNISFLSLPYTLESLRKAMEAAGFEFQRDTFRRSVEIMRQPHRTRPPRIVVVDDESGSLKMFALLIRDWFKDVTLLEFSNSSDAWQELSRMDPDLLILDMPLTGVDMLPLLAERKVKYPIFVTSGFYGEKEMRQRADPNLRVSCLVKPFTIEQFNRCLLTHVGPSDNPQREVQKQPANTRRKILLVDDDPDLLDIYREILVGGLPGQPEIRTAVSGPLGLAMLEIEPFHLLICGLHMPKMDGLEVLSIVRRKYPELRKMMLTSVRDERVRARAYELGVDLFWNKPGSEEEMKKFLEAVKSLLNKTS